ncbi:plasmid stabilization protein StbC [Caballeronia sp. TF1N1]|uniref:plasmid stabilization protein StbC n=1 Tax=Caballeronia sp. TF1N1 TaxID=2878153 RepID=UPI001FD5E528|nr:plasmid stabilization protein StbC [Caballeronia sp. TF1N1]
MDRPPSKEEVLLEWFLGDSKEIAANLKVAVADAESVRERIVSAKGELDATVQAATRELVAAHRELAQTLRDAKASHADATRSVSATTQGAVSAGVRRSIPLLVVCCGTTATIGATIGAAIAILMVRHLA